MRSDIDELLSAVLAVDASGGGDVHMHTAAGHAGSTSTPTLFERRTGQSALLPLDAKHDSDDGFLLHSDDDECTIVDSLALIAKNSNVELDEGVRELMLQLDGVDTSAGQMY
jgi:hypothetical protein